MFTSKKVFSAWFPQNPLALMSRCASPSVVVVCQWKVSPVSGCMQEWFYGRVKASASEMSTASRLELLQSGSLVHGLVVVVTNYY